MKKIILLLCAIFMTILSLSGVFSLTIFIQTADFQEGRNVIIVICLLLVILFGFLAYKCYKLVFSKKVIKQNEEIKNSPIMDEILQERKLVQPIVELIPKQKLSSIQTVEENYMYQEMLPRIQDKLDEIPKEVQELLWIKGKEPLSEQNLLAEPSLIDTTLEIKYIENYPVKDIGYYPSYYNLSAENRYIYLNWLKDVTTPIPIGYVFIFYYGLERHLIFGKFEQAFEMIVKLRCFHNNSSFYAYSSDALLIAALYHRRSDLISKIDLNKATSKVSQFVIASLTGSVDSNCLIENCRDIGFTNQRYIKNDYQLFKQFLDKTLEERFGYIGYPILEEDFLKCQGTFSLVLANYSLKIEERIANAPDLSTNEEYKQKIFEILSEVQERVKDYKKKEKINSIVI